MRILFILLLLLVILLLLPRREHYISYDLEPGTFPVSQDTCVKWDPLPISPSRSIASNPLMNTPYYAKEPEHVRERNKRCYHLSFEDCMVTPTCGWKGQQKLNGEWKGHCYPGTTDGPLDPLKSPNREEGEVWLISEPNPWVAM